jgi:hypothetical protein
LCDCTKPSNRASIFTTQQLCQNEQSCMCRAYVAFE